MTLIADLHVHSRYSRATSRDLDLERLAWWAARKGIGVVGTGDCVHPAWQGEIADKLVPAEGGLFRLRPDIEKPLMETLPPSCRHPVSFMLTTEISTIYKKGDKTRKVHHLIHVAGQDANRRLAAALAGIGNIASDGRPILGLDSRDLLETVLEADPANLLVPAHIWTPWFAALGSQSGFDSIAECYGDLAPHIVAVETGLSSDPPMNWRISSLDGYRLVSNSDAHSPSKLGREATRFSCAADYDAIRHALATGEGYVGTLEFFPEEGKYHMDGHRDCAVRLSPKETLALGGICPVCGARLTIGVAHRVEALADRGEGAAPPPTAGRMTSLVPLPEILAEILGTGAASKKVGAAYDRATAALGPELALLEDIPLDEIGRVNPLLGEAVARLRQGTVRREAGYDGEYGVIRLFEPGELDHLGKGGLLFDAPAQTRARPKAKARVQSPAPALPAAQDAPALPPLSGQEGLLAGLDPDQAAAAAAPGPLAVVAGPGSGKTRMLTHRLAYLVAARGTDPAACLAVTFTRKATEELRERLAALLPGHARPVAVESFHSLGLAILRAHGERAGLAEGFRIAPETERVALLAQAMGVSESRATRFAREVSVLKRTGAAPSEESGRAASLLGALAQSGNWVDFDDLVVKAVRLLEEHDDLRALWRGRYLHIVADEFQDIDEQQYRLLRLIAGTGEGLCVIGDPDQAIYGFRGAHSTCFARFQADFSAATLALSRNYRSSATIVAAASRFIGGKEALAMRAAGEAIAVHSAPDETAEAVFVATHLESLLGGHDFIAAQQRRTRAPAPAGRPLGFGDCAVLYRSDAQAAAFRAAFDRAGIPYQKSRPARLDDHAGVATILAALEQDREAGGQDLARRLEQAADSARRAAPDQAVPLAEASFWLGALAGGLDGTGDEAALREAVALSNEADFRDARAERVSLLTMHAAKGLEFSIVYVAGLEAGLIPFSWGPEEETDPEHAAEERRLFYVAMTRAKDRLILTRARSRFRQGARRVQAPSPYLDDIPAALVRREETSWPARTQGFQMKLF